MIKELFQTIWFGLTDKSASKHLKSWCWAMVVSIASLIANIIITIVKH